MKITVSAPSLATPVDALLLGLSKGEAPTAHSFWGKLPPSVRTLVQAAYKNKGFTGDYGSIKTLTVPSGKIGSIVLVGLGAEDEWTLRRLRLTIRKFGRLALEQRWKTVGIVPTGFTQANREVALQAITENLIMAEYDYRGPRTVPRGGWPAIQKAVLLTAATAMDKRAVERGRIIAEAVNVARTLANTPGGDMTPTVLGQRARELGTLAGISVRILGAREMEKLNMGAILGVAKGSTEEPKLIIMEYRGGKKGQAPLVMVGKGVTFDSGGINLKPERGMVDMHMDMAGGAATIGAILAMAELRVPINAVTIVPAVENMPSGSSFRPGDLLQSMSGKIIEVLNTDAEGRVILADALTYAQKQYAARLTVDVATLTGSAVVALGQRAIAAFTKSRNLEDLGRDIGEASGDYVWPLPMWEEYAADVQGTFGDVSNVGKSRYGDAISGAMFLSHFAGEKPWIHLDIAPTMTPAEGDSLAKGATGSGVRFLVELARRMADDTIRL